MTDKRHFVTSDPQRSGQKDERRMTKDQRRKVFVLGVFGAMSPPTPHPPKPTIDRLRTRPDTEESGIEEARTRSKVLQARHPNRNQNSGLGRAESLDFAKMASGSGGLSHTMGANPATTRTGQVLLNEQGSMESDMAVTALGNWGITHHRRLMVSQQIIDNPTE